MTVDSYSNIYGTIAVGFKSETMPDCMEPKVCFFFHMQRNSLIFAVEKKIQTKRLIKKTHFVCKNTLSEILNKTAHVLRDVENKLTTAPSPFPKHDFTIKSVP